MWRIFLLTFVCCSLACPTVVEVAPSTVRIRVDGFVPLVSDGEVISPFTACIPVIVEQRNAFVHTECVMTHKRLEPYELAMSMDGVTMSVSPGLSFEGPRVTIISPIDESGMFCLNVNVSSVVCDLSYLSVVYECEDQPTKESGHEEA